MTSLVIAEAFGIPSIAGWFKNLRKAHEERKAISKTIKELSKLTDKELSDIGIGRCDIRRVAEGGSR